MAENPQVERPSSAAELQLAAAPQVMEALRALARSACRQLHAARAAVLVEDGQERHVICSDSGDWPDGSHESAVLHVAGLPAGSLQVAGSKHASGEALADLAAIGSALLESRLGEMRLRALGERARSASAAGSDWLWETDAGFVPFSERRGPRRTDKGPNPYSWVYSVNDRILYGQKQGVNIFLTFLKKITSQKRTRS